MNGSTKILPTHLDRQAVVYIRQSDPKQVLRNRESAINQRALSGRLLELGWKKGQISIVDEDQGISAKHAAGREAFQKLAADVGLRKVGVVMGYEVSRLSRNSADWHRLLELCSLFDTLIGDTDGIYNCRDFNDRLLLGLKGTMSEAELHSLRLRLDAGRISKAKRGELVQHVPSGYIRMDEGKVILDPDIGIQQRIRLVFGKFVELGSAHKVLGYLARNNLKLPRRQTSGLYAGDVLWKEPSVGAIHTMLRNPAYAGAFAYGQRGSDPARQIPGRPATGRLRRPRSQWIALVKDVYPPYISWSEYELIQKKVQENRQKMQELFTRKRGIRKGAALLSGLVRCAFCGHHLSVAYKEKRFQYKCDGARSKYGRPSCQHVSGRQIDEAVLEEFFNVIRPAQIDALEQVSARQAKHQHETVGQLEKEFMRVEYEAKRAERQYNQVDPENRLIAASLEKKWENALADLEQAKAGLAQAKEALPSPLKIPAELRHAFADAGKRLPEMWPRLSIEAKKSLIRTLVSVVNLRRNTDGTVQVRIAWRGGIVSERMVKIPVFSLRHLDADGKLLERLRELADKGLNNQGIAARLNQEGLVPCRGEMFTWHIVRKLRLRHDIFLNVERVRRGDIICGYTVPEMARLIKIDPSWIYHRILDGRIRMEKHSKYGCYLFPKNQQAIDELKGLKNREVRHVSFQEVH